jgi:hypothetical protein
MKTMNSNARECRQVTSEDTMKTRTDPKTKTQSVSLEGWEARRIRETRDVLLTFKSQAIVEADQAIIALDLFVLALTPKPKPPPGPLTPPNHH